MFHVGYEGHETYATSSAARSTTMPQIPASSLSPSSELALVDEYPPAEFINIRALKEVVASKRKELHEGAQDQYLSFRHVTSEDFATIKARRVEIMGRGPAFFYLGDIETLIIKFPTRAHEKAHATLGQRIQLKVFRMGIAFREFTAVNATAMKGGINSEMEGDTSWINQRLRPNKTDWPNLVIEAGMSEPFIRLQNDAKWWIQNSAGDVLIILVVWIRPTIKKVKIEKWIPASAQPLRRSAGLNLPQVLPTKVADIEIDQSSTSVCHGAPLLLEFDRVFGRPPQQPLEHDIVFTQQELEDWARDLWVGI
ncbi:hypothetical protein C8Q69DRAFT_517266 [Paecilomyces variotii]|uniref:Uncharacterized protein n=1 Tax=Byssochlamys spectabilis TaxID=264951 RepID=A0A443I2L9_BYSSP|nr:hypothetical protein C8Q69DRAFT_517266 [Paecilomyces variotii]KAJ9364503.1 hypothetical protein DTO280E4_1749 [Paecilomyces variotii]RWQ98298.1 hypothetical protein C8Q69DRAFT_517266 [Paecilomyces variotii]